MLCAWGSLIAGTTAFAQTSAEQATDWASVEALTSDSGGGAPRYLLEAIVVEGNTKTRESVILDYLPFRVGDVLDAGDPALRATRYRLLGTGFFREVQLALRKGSRRGAVALVISVAERNTVVATDLEMGLSADADTQGRRRPLAAFAGVAGAERNLAGTGVMLGSALAISQGGTTSKAFDQLALRVRFFDRTFLSSQWALSGELLYNDALDFFGNSDVRTDDERPGSGSFAVLEYRRFGGRVGAGIPLSLASQLWLSYRLETIGDVRLPRAAAHSYGDRLVPIDFRLLPGNSVLSTLRASLHQDTRDHPLLPTRGWEASSALEVSLTPAGSDYPYARLDLEAQAWMPLGRGHVFSAYGYAGAIAGDAPVFEQYYVGDFTDFQPGRLLGLNFDRRPSPNFLGTTIEEVRYAKYALKIGAEYRIPLYRGNRSVYAIDFFGTLGAFALASDRELRRPVEGASGLELVPVDLTGNLGFRLDTSLGGFTFAFSNVLGFLPVRRGDEQ